MARPAHEPTRRCSWNSWSSSISPFRREPRRPRSPTANGPRHPPPPQLANAGHLIRLWRLPGGPGEAKAIGVYRADSQPQLDGLLRALPLYEWLKITVTPLAPHPNDPVAMGTAAVSDGAGI